MNIVIDARISDNAGQQVLSNLFEDIKHSLSIYVTDHSQSIPRTPLLGLSRSNPLEGLHCDYFVKYATI